MKYVCEKVGATTVVTPLDEALDAGGSKEFRKTLEPELEGRTKVLLDLGNVRFVDSSGLGAIIALLRLVEGGGGTLRLCGLGPEVRKAVELVRMDRLIDILPTRDDALLASGEAPAVELET